jgi:hypothetical protein
LVHDGNTETIAGTGVHGFNGNTDSSGLQNAKQTQLGHLYVHIMDFIVIV